MIATDGGGLNILNIESGKISNYKYSPDDENSLCDNSVNAILTDKNNGIWLGHNYCGISYFNPPDWLFVPFRHQANLNNSLSDNHVNCFFQDNKSNIWIGTSNGLNLYDASSNSFKAFYSKNEGYSFNSNYITAINEASDRFLWIGTYGGGIQWFDKKSYTFQTFKHPNLPANLLDKISCNAIAQLKGKLYFATYDGLLILDTNSNDLRQLTEKNSNLTSNLIYSILASDGLVWLGTIRGVDCYNPETDKITRIQNEKIQDKIISLGSTETNKILIGTETDGLYMFDNIEQTLSPFQINKSLTDYSIRAILRDSNGFIWISTDKGLIKYKTGEQTFTRFTKTDGLQSDEFSPNSALISQSGNLFFGGINGFNSFDPGKTDNQKITSKVLITNIIVLNQEVNPDEEGGILAKQAFLSKRISLKHSQASIEIHFSTPGMMNRDRYIYSYILEGADAEWSNFSTDHFAKYSKLPPGKYTFKVKMKDISGKSGECTSSLEIQVYPPWWRTYFAYACYFILVFSLLTLITYLKIISERYKLLRKKFSDEIHKNPPQPAINKADDEFLQRIIAYVENADDPGLLEVSTLCREFALSHSVLYRKIKTLTGNSIADFIRTVKMKKACQLLAETKLPISQIALDSGFPNPKHFATSFRKQFGKSPSEFRNQLQS